MSLDPKILNDAANEIRAAANRQRAQLALADALVGIASIENAANEARARLDQAKREEVALAETRARLDAAAETDCAAKRAAAETALAEARTAAAAIATRAEDRAREIIADAQAQAAAIETDLHDALADRRKALALAEGSLAAVNVAIDAARATIAELDLQVVGKQLEHTQLVGQHQAFLASIGAK